MATTQPEKAPLFNFLAVRAAEPVSMRARRRDYIDDDNVLVRSTSLASFVPEDRSSLERRSLIAAIVYEKVFCRTPRSRVEALEDLLGSLLEMLEVRQPTCDGTSVRNEQGLQLRDLSSHLFERGGTWYLIPERVDELGDVAASLVLLVALRRLRAAIDAETSTLDTKRLRGALENILGKPVDEIVFADGGHSAEFSWAKRVLFDRLYLLYMLRRWMTVNLGEMIEALQLLHVLQALAVDVIYERVRANGVAGDQLLLISLSRHFSALEGWSGKADVAGFPLIDSAADLLMYREATPVVHPIFARLFWYRKPFNDVQPIGVGDLKVVKHWLRGYTLGDISHVENILKGETKQRVYRNLEKTEDVFSFQSESQSESTRDTQTTDRNELKREVEQVIKSDLSVGAGANVNVTYTGGTYSIVAGVNANFAYARSQTDTAKLAQNFAHEVVDRATQRIYSRTTQQRTTTVLFETEETDTHGFNNVRGRDHVSGFYYWLNKAYRAQVYNYGKRMMFEFTIPEPAAFLVESRLRALEAQLDVPKPPSPPKDATLPPAFAKLRPRDITLSKFRELARTYDLSKFEYPALTKTVEFIDVKSGNNLFSEQLASSSFWHARTYSCRIGAKGYRITKLILDGAVYYYGADLTLVGTVPVGEWPPVPKPDINSLDVTVDGTLMLKRADNTSASWYLDESFAWDLKAITAPAMADDTVSIRLGFWDAAAFDLSVRAELALSNAALEIWQNQVYAAVRAIEQKKVDDENANRRQTYQARLATYHGRLAELKAMAINDLLQGQSELANRAVILRELKRQCLAMLAREFDADASDDLLTDWETIGSRSVKFKHHQFNVDEKPNADNPTSVTVDFDPREKTVDYPVPDVVSAREKGRFVQFLEQAFEWRQLAYICYPYFWATTPRWIELMNRSDRSDPFYSDFLQAGYARVMVAVTPVYDDAVLHFLATREPWDGGPSPVIGDPLYLPIYEELRRQQDDLAGATSDGAPWDFTLPTSLVYLQNNADPLPPLTP